MPNYPRPTQSQQLDRSEINASPSNATRRQGVPQWSAGSFENFDNFEGGGGRPHRHVAPPLPPLPPPPPSLNSTSSSSSHSRPYTHPLPPIPQGLPSTVRPNRAPQPPPPVSNFEDSYSSWEPARLGNGIGAYVADRTLNPAIQHSGPPHPPPRTTSTSSSMFSLGPPRNTSASSSGSSVVNSQSTRFANQGSTLSPNSSLSFSAPTFRQASSRASVSTFGADVPAEFVNPSFLSNIAVFVKDRVPRGLRLKQHVEYRASFTSDELVTTIQQAFSANVEIDRTYALQLARTLQGFLWFHEVDWEEDALVDGNDDKVYTFDEEDPFTDYTELPTGVLTKATRCYSPMCAKLNEEGSPMESCYSYSCPNKPKNNLRRHSSAISTLSATEANDDSFGGFAKRWADQAGPDLISALSKAEIDRQCAIAELAHVEKNYLQDLGLIESGFETPLRTAEPPIIPPERLDDFFEATLLNTSLLREQSRQFYTALAARQRSAGIIVSEIGDIVLAQMRTWGDSYFDFICAFPLAKLILQKEDVRNPYLHQLLSQFQALPGANRKPFDSFHSRPLFLFPRYKTMLEAILKYSTRCDADPVELANLQEAIDLLADQASRADNRTACVAYERQLMTKSGVPSGLDLLEPSRRFLGGCKIYRKAEGSGFTEWVEAHLLLFDHYFVVTKPPKPDRSGGKVYPIQGRPIPLELVQLRPSSFSSGPIPRSSGFHLRSRGSAGGPDLPSEARPALQDTSTLVYPISFNRLGPSTELVTYCFETSSKRREIEKKLTEAIELRVSKQAANQVFRLVTLSDKYFGAPSVGSLNPPAGAFVGRPTCSSPLEARDGNTVIPLIVVGCETGLFVCYKGRPSTMKPVLRLPGITALHVLPEFSQILILADKVLIAYSLEALIPSASSSANPPPTTTPQRLSGKQEVIFFKVGKIGTGNESKTLVIYAKQNGKETVFKALQPLSAADRAKPTGGHRLFGLGGGGKDWYRTYKDFFIPSPVSSVQFFRSKLAIVRLKGGVEIMDLEDLRTLSLPDFTAHRQDPVLSVLSRRCEEGKTLGLFRLQDDTFSLVYDDLVIHCDRHGNVKANTPIFEWEGRPTQVAYSEPFLVGFSATLIEIRNAFSGQLVQLIQGAHLSLTHSVDGTKTSDSTATLHFTQKVGEYHALFSLERNE